MPAEAGDGPVGFVLTLPDVKHALVRAGVGILPLGWLRLARAISIVRDTRLVLLRVVLEHRGRRVTTLLAGVVHRVGRRTSMYNGKLSLIRDPNDPMRHVIDAFGSSRIKTFRLFGRDMDSG